jgi:hypothetical protein
MRRVGEANRIRSTHSEDAYKAYGLHRRDGPAADRKDDGRECWERRADNWTRRQLRCFLPMLAAGLGKRRRRRRFEGWERRTADP